MNEIDPRIYDIAINPTPDQKSALASEGAIRRAQLKKEQPPASISSEDFQWAEGQFARYIELYDYLGSVGGQEAQMRRKLMWSFPKELTEEDWEGVTPIARAQYELGLIQESMISSGVVEPLVLRKKENAWEQFSQFIVDSWRELLEATEKRQKDRTLEELEEIGKRSRPSRLEGLLGKPKKPKDPLLEQSEAAAKSHKPFGLPQIEGFPKKTAIGTLTVLGTGALLLLGINSGWHLPGVTVIGQSPKPGETQATPFPADTKIGVEMVPQPTSLPKPTLEDFLNQPITIQEGESLFRILGEQANSFGVKWINPENGVTKGDVVADIVRRLMKKRGLNPDQIQPGQFSLANLDLNLEEREVIKATLDSQSVADYQENVEPEVRP